MKLLFLSQYYPPETGAGATRAVTLRKYLVERGWKVDVISEIPNYPSGTIPDELKGKFSIKHDDDGGSLIQTWVIPTRRETFIQQLMMFGSFLLSSLCYGMMNPKKYDAVYATSPPIFSALSGLLLARLYRVPFFFEVRDLWPDAAVGTGQIDRANITYKISKSIERYLYKKADLVIPVTQRSEKLIKKTCPQANTFVVYNGVDTDCFKPVIAANEHLSEKIFSDSTFKVGYIGTIGVIHDMETLVKAAKITGEIDTAITFVIIGDGSRSHHLQQLLDEYRPGNVEWLGNQPHHQIPAYLSTLDIALNPVNDTDVFESILTVKFFEYLACNIPVISTAKGLIQEVGDASGAAITIPPGDPQKLAETIIYLKNNASKREELASNARPFVQKYFDRKVWAGVLSEKMKSQLGITSANNTEETDLKNEMSKSGYNW